MPYVLAIVPTVGVGALFYFVIKSILEGDRRERLAQARWEAEHDRREAAAERGVAGRRAGRRGHPDDGALSRPERREPSAVDDRASTTDPSRQEHRLSVIPARVGASL